MRAAPWVLPILDDINGPAVQALLVAVDAQGLDFVSPGTNPLPYEDDTRAFNDTLAAATVYAPRLTKWSDRPMWFDGGPGESQVLLTQDASYMYAWVGSNAKGVLVAYDTENLIGFGLDEPGVRAALAHALGWFVDVSISIRKSPSGTAGIRRATDGPTKVDYRYVPTPIYARQAGEVARGHNKPPRLHAVQSHLRRLNERNRPPPREPARPAAYAISWDRTTPSSADTTKATKRRTSSTLGSQATRCWPTSSDFTKPPTNAEWDSPDAGAADGHAKFTGRRWTLVGRLHASTFAADARGMLRARAPPSALV